MEWAFVGYASLLFGSLAGAWVISGLRTFRIERACRKLDIRIGDIEDRLASVKGKEAAKARWSDKQLLDEVLKVNGGAPKAERYDNDPVY